MQEHEVTSLHPATRGRDTMAEQQLHYIYKTYKYRLYPTKAQQEFMAKIFGCSPWVWNYFRNHIKEVYQEEGIVCKYYDLCRILTVLKKMEGYRWLTEAPALVLIAALKDLDEAYKNFCKGIGGEPGPRSKHSHKYSFTVANTHLDRAKPSIEVFERGVKLPKLGIVRTKVSRPCKGTICSATVKQVPSGKYYIFVVSYEAAPKYKKPNRTSIGIDLGVKNFATCSDGVVIQNPLFLDKQLERLSYEQSKLSRKTKGSKRYEKQRIKVAKLYEKIKNQRADFQQKLSTAIVKHHGIVCVEDLDIRAMVKGNQLAGEILDVAWGYFLHMLEYKCNWNRRWYEQVNRYYPSTQTCSHCGYVYEQAKDTHIRQWTCPNCSTQHDRDINAAKNIELEGVRMMREQYLALQSL